MEKKRKRKVVIICLLAGIIIMLTLRESGVLRVETEVSSGWGYTPFNKPEEVLRVEYAPVAFKVSDLVPLSKSRTHNTQLSIYYRDGKVEKSNASFTTTITGLCSGHSFRRMMNFEIRKQLFSRYKNADLLLVDANKAKNQQVAVGKGESRK